MQIFNPRRMKVFIAKISNPITSAQFIRRKRTIAIHEAQEKIKSKRREVQYRFALDPFFVANFEDASKPPAYILDVLLIAPISGDLFIGTNHQNESANYPTLYNHLNAWEFWHSAHVDGVFGAKKNNSVKRGTNPGIDLSFTKNINPIKIISRSSVALFNIKTLVYSFAPASNSTKTESGAYQRVSVPKHGDQVPITIPLATDINTRYLKFNWHNHGSWFAMAEIKVFGL